jgi:CheY-like chemotaxis protein/HD-like signal output (HDOD) protein
MSLALGFVEVCVMPRILVIDDAAILREPLAASLRHAGYETHCAADGSEALKLLPTVKPNLILLDMTMPGMDGLAFLRQVRSEKAYAQVPVILLTAVSDKAHVLEAAKLKVQGYILKSSFSMKQLLETVKSKALEDGQPSPEQGTARPPGSTSLPNKSTQRAATPPTRKAITSIPVLLAREQCVERAQQALQAKTLSGVVMQVITLAASPRADTAQLTTLIARDSMLSARVLKAANSANYASSRGIVTTIPDAVRNIGASAVRNIAAAMGIFDAMPETSADGFNPIRCWQHSFAVARLCEQLAALNNPDESGVAYLVGLCHDLGEILLRSTFAAEYRQVLEVHEGTGRPLDELEREMLGMGHSDLVLNILACLGLPETIRTPIETFYRSVPEHLPPTSAHPLAKVLRIADLYANGLLLASSGASCVMPLTTAECRAATGQESPARPDSAQLRSEILSLTGSLARLSTQEEAECMKPLYPAAPTKIWVAHDRALSEFDPVVAALSSLATVDLHDRLPLEARECSGHQALVVIARSENATGFRQSALCTDRQPSLQCLNIYSKTSPTMPDSPPPAATSITLAALAEFVASLGSK